jgi:kinesin family protein C1
VHAREIDELERTVARKDREKRNIEEELRDRADEATRDREAIRELKVRLRPRSSRCRRRLMTSNPWLRNLRST